VWPCESFKSQTTPHDATKPSIVGVEVDARRAKGRMAAADFSAGS
jgi:hypothetical protein